MLKIPVYAAVAVLFALHSCTPITQQESVKTMLIDAKGEAEVRPDEASLVVYLNCTDRNIKKSKACLIEKSEALNAQILGYGIAEEDILTTAINQSKEYNWSRGSRVFVGYKSSLTTHLKVRDLNVLEALYTELLMEENLDLGGLNFSYSKMDSLNHAAYQNALANANALADNLLMKMEETNKEILRIGNTDLPAIQYDRYDGDKRKGIALESENVAKPSISINNGTMKVYQRLVVEYKID